MWAVGALDQDKSKPAWRPLLPRSAARGYSPAHSHLWYHFSSTPLWTHAACPALPSKMAPRCASYPRGFDLSRSLPFSRRESEGARTPRLRIAILAAKSPIFNTLNGACTRPLCRKPPRPAAPWPSGPSIQSFPSRGFFADDDPLPAAYELRVGELFPCLDVAIVQEDAHA